jgi:hypothetical protein
LLIVFGNSCAFYSANGFPPLLPDSKLTPGKVARGPRDSRGVTQPMREKVFARYGIRRERWSDYTIDHLVPTELGGADDIKNLWPQRLDARPYNPHRKQLLTRRFLEMIAGGRITLAEAQQEMKEDWISAFVVHIGMVHLTPGNLSASE